MNLKEACRYANYLQNISSFAQSFLWINENFVERTEKHNLPSGATTLTRTLNTINEDLQTKDIPSFILNVIEEKAKLETSIAIAKQTLVVDYVLEDKTSLKLDSAISYNKSIRNLISVLESLVKVKKTETRSRGTDYTYNVAGDQVPYVYNIDITEVSIFDRDTLITTIKKLKKQADLLSKKIDETMLKECILFEPKYDMYDGMI